MYLLARFIVHSWKTVLTESWIMRICHSCTNSSPFAPNKKTFRKTINVISMYVLALSLYKIKKKKKILRAGLELWGSAIFQPICPKIWFSQSTKKPIKLLPFIHAHLHSEIKVRGQFINEILNWRKLKSHWQWSVLAVPAEPYFSKHAVFAKN